MGGVADATTTVAGGRVLGYADVGDPAGTPVFYFHGGGDSRLTRHPDDGIAAAFGVRLVAPDRPGCGLSTIARRRTLLGWADDVRRLADSLGIDRFAVVGWSAGGPHALACARALDDRVTRAAVVAGMPDPAGFAHLPADLRRALHAARRLPRAVEPSLARWARQPPAATGDPLCDAAYAAGRVEAFRSGPRGLARELAMLARPWGFRVEEIGTPVRLWYGTRDAVCPVAVGEDLARRLPHAELTVTDDTHQLLFPRWREILEDVAAATSEAAAQRTDP